MVTSFSSSAGDDGSFEVYLDGNIVDFSDSRWRGHKVVGSENPSSVFSIADSGTGIPSAATRTLSGSIQNFCIWQGQLTGSDAIALYNSGSIKDPTDGTFGAATLKDWWRFDSGSTGFQSAGSSPAQATYVSNNGRNLIPSNNTNWNAVSSVIQGVPFERHTTA